ncbi:MAG: hypothetical protein ABIP51_03090 [Bacteroidia bacterium]
MTDSEIKTKVLEMIGSVALVLFTVYATMRSQKRKEKQDSILKLRYEMLALCQSIMSNAYYSSSRELEALHRYAMHKAKPDEDFDKHAHIKYVEVSEEAAANMHKDYNNLISKLGLMSAIWDIEAEVFEVKRLVGLSKSSPYILIDLSHVFNDKMTVDEIKKAYEKHESKIRSYIADFSWGENLCKIQNILDPSLAKQLSNKR